MKYFSLSDKLVNIKNIKCNLYEKSFVNFLQK
uniref:Uncharacterized protein n=1 Tax=viral metagenome TaxID=1070528 RepID=A0A6C0ADV6_9ZZZZ